MGFRELLEKRLEGLPPEMALEFSGGIDSFCLLTSLLTVGYRPALYTYVLEGVKSEDAERAKFIAQKHGLKLTLCEIPYDLETLVRDIRKMIRLGIFGIVDIQFAHGHLYTAREISESIVLNGGGPDEYFGTYKDVILAGGSKDKNIFDQMRHKYWADPDFGSRITLKKIFGNREVYLPYVSQEIYEYALQFSWEEMNKPKVKWLLQKDYAPEIEALDKAFRPQRGNQYFVAGVKPFHEELLKTSYNRKNYKRIDGVYREIKKEMEVEKNV